MTRRKILISAFACEPNYGSEPEVGWRWVTQMARFHDVTVLTHTCNRERIEQEVEVIAGTQPLPEFHYFQAGQWRWRMHDNPAMRPYYMVWQRAARRVVAELHRRKNFALMHHVTFAGCRYPTAIWGHGVPAIWGPVGGMEPSPLVLASRLSLSLLIYELFRFADNAFAARPGGKLARRGARSALVLASTRETQDCFARLGISAALQPTIGMDAANVSTHPIELPTGPLRLLFVGRLLDLKGLDLGLHALAQSGTDARLTVIGKGPAMHSARRLAQALGIGDRVEFVGKLAHSATLEAYRDYHVFLFPALHDSGAFAVLEAMSKGLPVICLDCGGPAITVTEQCGRRIHSGPKTRVVEDLAAAICEYAGDRKLVVAHGIAAREEVRLRYDWNHLGEVMAERYSQVLDHTAGSALRIITRRCPRFSIVTPSFRQLGWLKLCAASVEDQRGVEVEHIVQDAGTGPELETWAATQRSISLHVEQDEGMYDAVQRGLGRASGEFLAYLNCDEEYLEGALQTVALFFQQRPDIEVVFGDAILVRPDGSPISLRRAVIPLRAHVRLVHLNTLTCATFFRRTLIDRGFTFDPRWRAIGDAVWVERLLAAGVRMAVLPEPLATFTFTGENLGTTPRSRAEMDEWRGAAWKRLLVPFISAHHRIRKWRAGAYRPQRVSYGIYTQDSLAQRVPFRSERLGYAWPS